MSPKTPQNYEQDEKITRKGQTFDWFVYHAMWVGWGVGQLSCPYIVSCQYACCLFCIYIIHLSWLNSSLNRFCIIWRSVLYIFFRRLYQREFIIIKSRDIGKLMYIFHFYCINEKFIILCRLCRWTEWGHTIYNPPARSYSQMQIMNSLLQYKN